MLEFARFFFGEAMDFGEASDFGEAATGALEMLVAMALATNTHTYSTDN